MGLVWGLVCGASVWECVGLVCGASVGLVRGASVWG